MTISLATPTLTPFGQFLEELAPTTVFATDDNGRWFINPIIHEEDGDCVVFEKAGGAEDARWSTGELIGRAVALATLTPQEALEIARQHRLHLTYNNRYFCWSAPTRRRDSEWCAGFRKKRGSRTHLIPVTVDQSLDLIAGTKKITYWTNSRRCEIVAA